ncbi:hypothetical protein VTL71DRAFT_16450 [Oculimacula yallundae]|uniref:Uncharacterized protein n=1 Tax=Oculimacula yallundae TaxID=86028 RepID=A0ABR4CFB4_9HELO
MHRPVLASAPETATAVGTSHSIVTAPEVLTERRDVPATNRRAQIYRDQNGWVKLIMPIVINKAVTDAFLGSGYNMCKEVFNQARIWMLKQGTTPRAIAIASEWSGQLNEHTRYLSESVLVGYGYFSILVKSDPQYAVTMANYLKTWVSQNGNSAVIYIVNNAQTVSNGPATRRDVDDEVQEQEFENFNGTTLISRDLTARKPDWCAAPDVGFWVQHSLLGKSGCTTYAKTKGESRSFFLQYAGFAVSLRFHFVS